jgi:ABC-type sugar transport system permease subunit
MSAGGLRRRSAGEAVMLLPLLVVMGIVILFPTATVLYHAFTDWQPGYESPWIGFQNFTELFESKHFRQILVNHGVLLLGIPLWVALPLGISFLLYSGVPFAGFFRAIFFFPATASPALLGIMFGFLLAPQGSVNSFLEKIGLGALAGEWLGDPALVKPVLIVVLAWATMGMGVVIFSAALSAVPPELFESAEIDGASWLQRLRHVVLPSIRRTVELWTVILVIVVFTAIFPWIFTLTRGGPGFSSTTLDWDVYQNALQYGYFGSAAAEAVFLLVLVMIVLTLGSLLARRATRTP